MTASRLRRLIGSMLTDERVPVFIWGVIFGACIGGKSLVAFAAVLALFVLILVFDSDLVYSRSRRKDPGPDGVLARGRDDKTALNERNHLHRDGPGSKFSPVAGLAVPEPDFTPLRRVFEEVRR